MRENNKNGDQNNGSVEKVILGFPFATYFSESGEDEDEGRARIFGPCAAASNRPKPMMVTGTI